MVFRTEGGVTVPTVTADQMREVDRVAMEDFGLGVLQMMENAGRNLVQEVWDLLEDDVGQVAILAGSGGNGGGGLCCARHLHNRGFRVQVVLTKNPAVLKGPARNQIEILRAAGVEAVDFSQAEDVIRRARLVVDAMIGYSLRGAPRGRAGELIDLCNRHAMQILSLDLPSGLDATTGDTPGVAVRPDRTLTLALPKTGLAHISGELRLADIGIPPQVFERIGISFEPPFGNRYRVSLERE